MNFQQATLDAATETNTITDLNNGPVPDNIAFVQVQGTYGTAVLAFQGSLDGTNYDELVAVRLDTLGIEDTPNMSDNETRQWKVDCTGMKKFRVYMTSIASGAVECTVQTTYVPGGVQVALQSDLDGNQAISGTMTITSTSASALVVGANGGTNPVLKINANTASVATGITIVGAAAAGGVAMTVISSGTDENLTINAKGTGTVTINGTATGAITLGAATGVTGALTVTSAGASSLAVGRQGATNPTIKIDSSAATCVTGISVTSAAAAGGVAVAAISSGTDENLTINAKGAGTVTINGTATGQITLGANVGITDAKNIVLATTTGTKIGTATTQKLGFWNVTPVVQPTASADTTTGAAGGTNSVYLNTTFTGASGSSAYTIGGIVTSLKALGLIAA